jgi:tetratricopeptide (TPR) repeat protein
MEGKCVPEDQPDRDAMPHDGTPPTTFEAWCHLAGEYALDDQWYRAADAYECALALRPTDAATWARFGDALLKSRRTMQAAEAFVRELTLRGQTYRREPQDLPALGAASEGDEREAVLQKLAALDLGLLLFPEDDEYWYYQGNVLAKLGRREEALQAYDRALALGASDVFACGAKGQVLMELGRDEEALEAFRRAVAWAHFPGDWDLLGQVLMRLERHAEAADAFEHAIARAPNYGTAWLHLAEALRAQGRLAHAQEVERRGRALPPDDTSMPF